MRTFLIVQEKRIINNPTTDELAIAELKIWKVPSSKDNPIGRKFTLFMVVNGRVIVGIDNHRPKGPHLHLGNEQMPYNYESDQKLLEDFWDLVRKAGFVP